MVMNDWQFKILFYSYETYYLFVSVAMLIIRSVARMEWIGIYCNYYFSLAAMCSAPFELKKRA